MQQSNTLGSDPAESLIILGFSARAAAECAIQAGYRPIVVDFCGDRDLLALDCQYHSMVDSEWLDWLLDQNSNGPVLLTGGMEHQIQVLKELFGRSRQSCSTLDSILAMRDIQNWQYWAGLAEIIWPQSISLSDCSSRMSWLADSRMDWILKSQKSVGGQGVQDWTMDTDVPCASSEGDLDSLYLQQKLEGTGIGVTFLSSEFGSIPLGVAQSGFEATQSFMPKYTYRGSTGPFQLPEDSLAKLKSFASVAGQKSMMKGLWQADFVLNQDGLALLEINPRWSASMEILDVALDERLVGWHCACLNNKVCSDDWQDLAKRTEQRILHAPQRVFGKLIHYAPYDCVVTKDESSKWWEVRWDSGKTLSTECTWFAADIPQANTQVTRGQPVRTTMMVGRTKEQVVALGTHLSSSG